MRCDACGRFTSTAYDIWRTQPTPEIDMTVCEKCYAFMTRRSEKRQRSGS